MPWQQLLHEFAFDLAGFVFPARCPVCDSRTGTTGLCTNCESELTSTGGIYMQDEDDGIDHIYKIFPYNKMIRAIIHHIKYGGMTRLGTRLGELVAQRLSDGSIQKPDYICPIPLHPTRLRDRGYNQSEFIARPIAEALDAVFAPGLLKRRRWTNPQTHLSRSMRLTNLHEAFVADSRFDLAGGSVLLVDDVITTGSTMRECAHALRLAGASRVMACALAGA